MNIGSTGREEREMILFFIPLSPSLDILLDLLIIAN